MWIRNSKGSKSQEEVTLVHEECWPFNTTFWFREHINYSFLIKILTEIPFRSSLNK